MNSLNHGRNLAASLTVCSIVILLFASSSFSITTAASNTHSNIYVANTGGRSISIINANKNKVTKTISGVPYAFGLTYDPNNGLIYAVNGSGGVTAISTTSNKIVKEFDVGLYNVTAIFYAAGQLLIDQSTTPGIVVSVNPSTGVIVHNVTVGQEPIGISYAPEKGGEFYVSNGGNGSISVVNAKTFKITKTIEVQGNPSGMAYDSRSKEMLVADYGEGLVDVINTTSQKLIEKINVGVGPREVAVNSKSEAYVTNYWSGTVSVIKGSSVIATITVGMYPFAVVYDPSNALIYSASIGSDTVSVINRTSVVATIQVGSGPFAEVVA